MYIGLKGKSRLPLFAVIDLFLIVISFYGAMMLRFDFFVPSQYLPILIKWIPVAILIKLPAYYLNNLYRGMYRYTSLWDVSNIILSNTIASFILVVLFGFIRGYEGFPRSVFVLDLILSISLVSMSRIAVRLYYSHNLSRKARSQYGKPSAPRKKRLILIGAGRVGEKIARDILTTPTYGYELIGFVDDDIRKKGATLHGVRVLGSVSDLLKLELDYDELLIAVNNIDSEDMRQIIEICTATGKRFRTVPDYSEIIDGNITLKTVRDVSYLDLLGREEVTLDVDSIKNFIKGKRVLVSGAGGSIGSELVRQCIQYDPGMLILLDNSEYNLFTIQQELDKISPRDFRKCVLANIREKDVLFNTFRNYKPQVIIHAAAYKHVPLQELHPWEAVMTNVVGTCNLVEMALEHEVEKFVLVSTDKAVHPVNIMGATKRLAEIMMLSANSEGKTSFISVRFGNVLGSSGSVIPIFERQIKEGGPVKITHPEMVRYFMSIPEAAQLILQASALAEGGEIYVLNMGKPVKIKDMAYDLIRLSGFEPEKDIPVVYTGVRPGEKLFEELMFDEEMFAKTRHKKIMILENKRVTVEGWDKMKEEIHRLHETCKQFDEHALKQQLISILPEYKPIDNMEFQA